MTLPAAGPLDLDALLAEAVASTTQAPKRAAKRERPTTVWRETSTYAVPEPYAFRWLSTTFTCRRCGQKSAGDSLWIMSRAGTGPNVCITERCVTSMEDLPAGWEHLPRETAERDAGLNGICFDCMTQLFNHAPEVPDEVRPLNAD